MRLYWLSVAVWTAPVAAFVPLTHPRLPTLRLSSTTEAITGVEALTKWLAGQIHPDITHARFGALRGLQWNGDLPSTRVKIVELTTEQVLSVPMTEDWDARLAVCLWNEIRQGPSSRYHPYLQFLTQGSTQSIPPPTAEDALRHWTPAEKERLQVAAAGQRLLALEEQQQQQWRAKYARLADHSRLDYDEFAWAMEAVHSRSFCGLDRGVIPASLVVPLAAAGGGAFYLQDHPDVSTLVLGMLALVASLPLVLQLLTNIDSAVLLPIIDAANHDGSAASEIAYDPVRRRYALSIDNTCIDPATRQLFVTYGDRKDTEWLLNYGFLPGVGVDDENRHRRRQLLAETFLQRNGT